jgi:basic membrane protein A and related proteins
MSLRTLLSTFLTPACVALLVLCLSLTSYAANSSGNVFNPYAIPAVKDVTLKPVAVIYFTGGGSHSRDYVNAIKTITLESSREFKLDIREYALNDEKDLASTIAKIGDGKTGFIVIIEPHDISALMKIPSLYPDIHFSVIGLNEPMYLINVNSMLFKDYEGTFISGALAALQSNTGVVSFISKDDANHTRNLAYAFFQGAKYINPNIQVVQQLGTRHMFGNMPSSPLAKQQMESSKKADIAFVLDDELLANAVHRAKKNNQLIIATTPQALTEYPKNVLTTLRKHYDLALYAALRSYATRNWAPVEQNIGLGNGYIDYVLDGRNQSLFSRESIERTERTKDLIAQGIIKIAPLVQ